MSDVGCQKAAVWHLTSDIWHLISDLNLSFTIAA